MVFLKKPPFCSVGTFIHYYEMSSISQNELIGIVAYYIIQIRLIEEVKSIKSIHRIYR